jgi:glycosyltransferase involved in cell wall biosynthesis
MANASLLSSAATSRDQLGKGRPRVSVVTIFLNAEKFMIESIESVLAQTFDDWEYLLVDDGSNDSSSATAKDYARRYPGKIYYLEHDGHTNRGMSAARNLGIQHARGEYIAFIDSDDVWATSKLADQVAFLDTHPDVGMVCGTVIHWSSWSTGKDIEVPTGHRQDVTIYPPEASLVLYPLGKAESPFPSDMMLRTSLVREIGGFEDQFRGMFEDQAFLIKLYLAAPVYFTRSIWLKYRLHADSCVSVTHDAGKYHDSRLRFLNWFEAYIGTKENSDRRVLAALRRALRPYRNPRIDYLISLPAKVKNRFHRLHSKLRDEIFSFRL